MFDYYDTLITPEEVADMLGCGMNTTYSGKRGNRCWCGWLCSWCTCRHCSTEWGS